jgi:hypothetical protein
MPLPYPTYMVAQLISVNGNSCGILSGRVMRVEGSSIPEYREIAGEGDFQYIRCWRTTTADGTITWDLRIRYGGGGACNGIHTLQLTTAADDPAGPYCYFANGAMNCDLAQGATVNDD